MVAVESTEDEVAPLLTDRVSIAAVNGPASLVIAGDEDAVGTMVAELAARGRRTKRLRVSHAFHSPRMDAMLDGFAAVAARCPTARRRSPSSPPSPANSPPTKSWAPRTTGCGTSAAPSASPTAWPRSPSGAYAPSSSSARTGCSAPWPRTAWTTRHGRAPP